KCSPRSFDRLKRHASVWPARHDTSHGDHATEAHIHIGAGFSLSAVVIAIVMEKFTITTEAHRERRRIELAEDHVRIEVRGLQVGQVNIPEGSSCPWAPQKVLQDRYNPARGPLPIDGQAFLAILRHGNAASTM